ncbi:acetolactate synthase large subunit [Methanobrevibacter cuticularis]|uniref:Acetolactate synthase large subunit n=1 Tax=Methanobrevibacter cuticularis TaxID=47311 RepID=A0A166EKU9_9EURY|nr:thiamine pyrophosphate-binding protein [Methanobrevibacter cuticularis]KZX16768.1 acetolactate synthase large subunit [Methanobrevibacter cuticularis]
MNTSKALVEILEESNINFIFGHPGEQILPFYKALNTSKIKHILCKNEQGAAMAADAYARSSGNFGTCLATAGPGALNMVMGIATAFKDHVPMLVITGDVPNSFKANNTFQDVDLVSIFEPITIKTFNPHNGKTAILNIKEAIEILTKDPRGPVHLNLPKDVLLDEDIGKSIKKKINFTPNYDYSNIDLVIEKLEIAKKPLIILGAGIRWSKTSEDIKTLLNKYDVPIATTYHGNGIIENNNKLNLGMVGVRGTSIANFVFKNSDLILVLGASLNERTLNVDNKPLTELSDIFREYKSKIIHVNIDKSSLKGKINVHGDIKEVLNYFKNNDGIFSNISTEWINGIYKNHFEDEDKYGHNNNVQIKDKSIKIGKNDVETNKNLLKPQIAIKTILNNYQNSYIVNDAGSHTTWVTLFWEPNEGGQLVYSGGMAPMGYGLPGAIGVSIANPERKVGVIVGDGGIQMNIQELATIFEYNLPITIFLLNNSQLGIIRQWEKLFYDMDPYEVNLENPNFVEIANAYHIDSKRVFTKNELDIAIDEIKNYKKPFLIEILVDEEDIPLPGNLKKK